jgi:6-phosphogluconolactonase
MTHSIEARLEILADPDALALRVADWLLSIANVQKGRFSVLLSGGSTPRRLYERLGRSPYRDAIPWSRIHWFWGDERFVPRSDPQSNYRMVYEAMLSQVPIAATNVHPIPTEGIDPQVAAAAYESELKSFYGANCIDPKRPLFDVTLLGLGPDGHTASLFPGAPALEEREHWVAAVSDSHGLARITLTLPALDSSRNVAFLVEGDAKRNVVERFRRGDRDLPATHMRPVETLWLFADSAAAGTIGA